MPLPFAVVSRHFLWHPFVVRQQNSGNLAEMSSALGETVGGVYLFLFWAQYQAVSNVTAGGTNWPVSFLHWNIFLLYHSSSSPWHTGIPHCTQLQHVSVYKLKSTVSVIFSPRRISVLAWSIKHAVRTGVKLGLSHWGWNRGWGCSRIRCWGEYLDLGGTR